ncbi:hypothetical protein FXO38_26076 [Capsicum annuum]|nr:hypothetical protein FXO38_26076 [Capsicum annuum]
MFVGLASMVVNKNMGILGIAALWGLDTLVMIYNVGHISSTHLNSVVNIAFASCASIYISTSSGSNCSNCHREIDVQGRAISDSRNNSSWLRFSSELMKANPTKNQQPHRIQTENNKIHTKGSL